MNRALTILVTAILMISIFAYPIDINSGNEKPNQIMLAVVVGIADPALYSDVILNLHSMIKLVLLVKSSVFGYLTFWKANIDYG